MSKKQQNGAYRDTGLQEQSEKQKRKGLNIAETKEEEMFKWRRAQAIQLSGGVLILIIAIFLLAVIPVQNKQKVTIVIELNESREPYVEQVFLQQVKIPFLNVFSQKETNGINAVNLYPTFDNNVYYKTGIGIGVNTFILPSYNRSWNLTIDLFSFNGQSYNLLQKQTRIMK